MGPTLHPHLPYNWGSRLLCQIYTHLNSDLIEVNLYDYKLNIVKRKEVCIYGVP